MEPHLVIRPPGRFTTVRLRELWEFRDLGIRFAARDITLRYRQTALGVIWVVAQPLMAAGVFAFVFGKVAALPSEGVPYFLYAYAGMLAWTLVSNTLSKFSTSLVGNSGLVSKIYFPRLMLPLATIGSSMLDFGVALVMMAVLMAVAGHLPGLAVLLLPVWVALILMLGTGVGLTAAALMVKYRDVGYVLPVLTQLLLYATPIAYSLGRVPHDALTWVKLNPLTGVIVGLRWSLLGTAEPDLLSVTSSVVGGSVLLALGLVVFTRMERQFADVI